MIRNSEQHAEADKARKAGIDAKNEAETLIYSAEKSASEYKDKVPQAVTDAINAAIADARGVLDSGDAAAIKEKTNTLQQAVMKIGESMAGSQQQGQAQPGEGQAGPGEEKKE